MLNFVKNQMECIYYKFNKFSSLFIMYNNNPTDLQVAKLIEAGQSHKF